MKPLYGEIALFLYAFYAFPATSTMYALATVWLAAYEDRTTP